VVINEIEEFETLRLGFLITINETLLGVYDRLTNPQGTATATQLPQPAHFLDMKPALTWIQFILPEDLTHSPLQLDTLHDTFGPLGEIAEIFLFEPRPEGFIIFHDSLHIPNFDGILAPQHSLIRIKNPKHSSPPIRADGNRGNLLKTHDTRHAQGDIGMALSLSPSQAFVQDPERKPHVLLFHPQDSIAKNLLCTPHNSTSRP